MKHFTSLLVCCCHLAIVTAQSSKLSPVAEALFKNVKSKLTIAEKNTIATKTNFILSGNSDQPFASDKDSKEYPFAAHVYPTDINKDGKEDVFILFGNSYTSGNTESSISLYVKTASGAYTMLLGFPGTLPDVLTTVSKGYPDLLIGGPGMEFPVLRWNGKDYAYHHEVKDAAYAKLKKTGVDSLSKAYQEKL